MSTEPSTPNSGGQEPNAAPAEPAAPTAPAEPTRLPDDHPLVTALSSKKSELAEAKSRLQEYEDANKTEMERLSDALTASESKVTSTESELARLKAAVKFGIAEDDLDLLGAGTPAEIEQRAEKLAARFAASPEVPRPVPGLGKTPDDSASGGTQLERDLRTQLGI